MAIAYVQSAANHPSAIGGNGTSIGVAYSGAVAAGNLLVLFVSTTTSSSPTAVGDTVNGSNAWSLAGTWWTGSAFLAAIYYFANTGAGTPTVTVTWGVSCSNRSINIAEYSGLATTTPNDANAKNGIDTNSTAPTSGNTGVPANDGELFFAGLVCDGQPITITAGTALSYTKRIHTGDTFAYSSALEDAVQTTAAAAPADWTTSNNGRYTVCAATFKAAASGAALTGAGGTGGQGTAANARSLAIFG